MCKYDDDDNDDDDYYDEYDIVKCIMISCDWNFLFGKFWGSSDLAVMLPNFYKNHGLSLRNVILKLRA